MPRIKCQHNFDSYCDVTDDGQIDVDMDGNCVDKSDVTDEEYTIITGRSRRGYTYSK